MTNKTNEVTN